MKGMGPLGGRVVMKEVGHSGMGAEVCNCLPLFWSFLCFLFCKDVSSFSSGI